MPLDPAIRKELDIWLHKSREDLRAAELDLHAQPPLLSDALFHCQQACEKILKALLCALQTPFRKTHDLNELGALAMDSFPELDPHLDNIAHLTSYAVESRYPSDAPDPQLDEATANLELAKNFVSEITTLLAMLDTQK
jgi:HEPN domain-containing protein